MKTVDLMLIDGDYLCHRASNIYEGSNKGRAGLTNGTIFGFIRDLGGAIAKYTPTRVLVCFDKHPLWRRELFPGYKNRVFDDAQLAKREVMNKQRAILTDTLLPRFGIEVFAVSTQEADDCIAHAVWTTVTAGNSGDQITIVSADHDLYQLLQYPNVLMFNPDSRAPHPVMNRMAFRRQNGYEIEKWATFKALFGCESDKVPGIGNGVGAKTITKYLQSPDSVEDKKLLKITQFLATEQYQQNQMLVDLRVGSKCSYNLNKNEIIAKAAAFKLHEPTEESITDHWYNTARMRSKILANEFKLKV